MNNSPTTGVEADSAEENADPTEAVDIESYVAENPEEVAGFLETVARLQRTGTLDDLAELADPASLLTAAMDDEMATSVASTGSRLGEVADTAADDDVAAGLEDVLVALGEASTSDTEPVGALGLVRAIRDPETRAGLGVLLSIASALGKVTGERGRDASRPEQ